MPTADEHDPAASNDNGTASTVGDVATAIPAPLDPAARQRILHAENDSFYTMYQAAAAAGLGTGFVEVDGIRAVWSTRDEDPGFSCVLNLGEASDPLATLAQMEERARADGAVLFGVDSSPELQARMDMSHLAERGYVQDYQEIFWERRLGGPQEEQIPAPPTVAERAGTHQRQEFAETLNVGFGLPPDHVRGHVFASTIGDPDWVHYLVHAEEEPGSASALYIGRGVGQLFVASTRPPYRGRGAQTTFIRQRLLDAQAAGCTLATSQTVDYNASPRNMERHGFGRMYVRTIWGRQFA